MIENTKCDLYRYIYSNGYLVYRHCFDDTKCTIYEGAQAHKQALFINEIQAKFFCQTMNELIDNTASDSLAWLA